MDKNDLIKKIDAKIAELEKQENPNELLKKALLKRGIISKSEDITEDTINNIFDIIDKEINK